MSIPTVTFTASEIDAARAVGARWAEDGLGIALRAFDDRAYHGDAGDWPILHLDDVSAIPFVSAVPGVEEYQHRARVRAADGDLFVAVTAQQPGYADYCRDRLGMGDPEFVLADPVGHTMEVARACAAGSALERVAEVARKAGGLLIHPYMGIEAVWDLADAIQTRAGVPVRVLGPPPPVLWVANDKMRLASLITDVVGEDWNVPTRVCRSPVEMAAALRAMAPATESVALKRTRCASALGNAVYRHGVVNRWSEEELTEAVDTFLNRTEWDGVEEVLAVAWVETSVSPSTQLWLPPVSDGPPRLDGVYEQILRGPERTFEGSKPSTLGPAIDAEIAKASVQVAAALQQLGYVGRCSFDFIVDMRSKTDFDAYFVECNGRWGGTSTPMHLLDRLWGGPRPPYWAQDFIHDALREMPFTEILARVEAAGELYDPATGEGTYIFYNVGPLKTSGKLDVIGIGEDAVDARAAVLERLPTVLGLS